MATFSDTCDIISEMLWALAPTSPNHAWLKWAAGFCTGRDRSERAARVAYFAAGGDSTLHGRAADGVASFVWEHPNDPRDFARSGNWYHNEFMRRYWGIMGALEEGNNVRNNA
jgi:hypothetical protein